MTMGYVHSVESFGTVDGPGIRFIVFLQGCALRCLYCHNADTWDFKKNNHRSAEDVIQEALSYRPFMEASKGGITISGGDPLAQPEFLEALLREAKKHGLHTTLDTSGALRPPNLDAILDHTDLVLLDIKHIDDEMCKKLTGRSNVNTLALAEHLSERGTKIWIRHVLVPEWTLDEGALRRTAAFIQKLDHVEKVEILPYHEMGVYKWEALGLDYPLKGIKPPTTEEVEWAEGILQGTV